MKARNTTTQSILVLLTLALGSIAADASPVRIAVAGVGGAAADPATLQQLAAALRAELTTRVDQSVFSVVTREEMARVYEEQGKACAPDDGRCLVAASVRWSGRLFVRGRLTETADGLFFAASLESVRGFHVADAGTAVDSPTTAALAVPRIVDELLAKERAFRARMDSSPDAQTPRAEEAPAQATEPAPVVCHASQQGLVSRGDVTIDDGGVTFTSPLTNKWRKSWTQLDTLTPTIWFNHPALYLTTKDEFDPLYIWFASEKERDRCFHAIEEGVVPRKGR